MRRWRLTEERKSSKETGRVVLFETVAAEGVEARKDLDRFFEDVKTD